MLKPLLILSAVAALAITASYAPGPSAQEAKNAAKAAANSQARAIEIYKVDCVICHGETGNGKTDLAKDMGLTLGDWTDAKTLANVTDKDLFDIIRKGKGDKMPSEPAGRAKDEEVNGIIAFIRAMPKAAQAAAPAATN